MSVWVVLQRTCLPVHDVDLREARRALLAQFPNRSPPSFQSISESLWISRSFGPALDALGDDRTDYDLSRLAFRSIEIDFKDPAFQESDPLLVDPLLADPLLADPLLADPLLAVQAPGVASVTALAIHEVGKLSVEVRFVATNDVEDAPTREESAIIVNMHFDIEPVVPNFESLKGRNGARSVEVTRFSLDGSSEAEGQVPNPRSITDKPRRVRRENRDASREAPNPFEPTTDEGRPIGRRRARDEKLWRKGKKPTKPTSDVADGANTNRVGLGQKASGPQKNADEDTE